MTAWLSGPSTAPLRQHVRMFCPGFNHLLIRRKTTSRWKLVNLLCRCKDTEKSSKLALVYLVQLRAKKQLNRQLNLFLTLINLLVVVLEVQNCRENLCPALELSCQLHALCCWGQKYLKTGTEGQKGNICHFLPKKEEKEQFCIPSGGFCQCTLAFIT